jgi:hypothetical protein
MVNTMLSETSKRLVAERIDAYNRDARLQRALGNDVKATDAHARAMAMEETLSIIRIDELREAVEKSHRMQREASHATQY